MRVTAMYPRQCVGVSLLPRCRSCILNKCQETIGRYIFHSVSSHRHGVRRLSMSFFDSKTTLAPELRCPSNLLFQYQSVHERFSNILNRSIHTASNQNYQKQQLTAKEERRIQKCLLILELDCTDYTVHSTKDIKDSYVRLVKEYHPDKLTASSDNEKIEVFHDIQNAYNVLMEFYQKLEQGGRHSDTSPDEMSEENPNPAPQHRHYLNYDGVGYGSPSQRKRQYDRWRADQAAERVFVFRRDNMLRNSEDQALVLQEKEHKYTRKIKTSNMLLRMAEDMIKESMANGDFENLPGAGKQLKSSSEENPYVDAHTHKLNSVLINNGYAPQWMTLESEIKSTYRSIREKLTHTYLSHGTTSQLWDRHLAEFTNELKVLNKKIDTLNMIAPSMKVQMVHYRADLAVRFISNQAKVSDNVGKHDGTPSESTSQC